MSTVKQPTGPNTTKAHKKVTKDDQQVIDIAVALRSWTPAQAEPLRSLAKWSLESVTHLTEYEDEKANRILTAIAFLSALVGVVFAAIVQRYPFSALVALGRSERHLEIQLLIVVYASFAVYFVLLTLGAALTLWAVRPQFRIPKVWEHTHKLPGSFLFFQEILKVSGSDWASAFTQSSPDELQTQYIKNSILETYLIAQKIPKKLRPLKKGVWLFFASTVVLVVLLPMCVITIYCVDAVPAGDTTTSPGLRPMAIPLPAQAPTAERPQPSDDLTLTRSEPSSGTSRPLPPKRSNSSAGQSKEKSPSVPQ
jgi:NADH:ubiquinone oxidoreductase subunit 5 (subunit L)/multisubunit Na+/H+ antiporter MnhA subunit